MDQLSRHSQSKEIIRRRSTSLDSKVRNVLSYKDCWKFKIAYLFIHINFNPFHNFLPIFFHPPGSSSNKNKKKSMKLYIAVAILLATVGAVKASVLDRSDAGEFFHCALPEISKDFNIFFRNIKTFRFIHFIWERGKVLNN